MKKYKKLELDLTQIVYTQLRKKSARYPSEESAN